MREPSGSSRFFEVDEEFALMNVGQSQRVRGTVELMRTDKGVWVSAKLDSEALCTCSRCLSDCRQPVRMTIEEECLPNGESDIEAGVAVDKGGTEEKVGLDENHILDLTEAVRQYSALSMPMKPVCRDDCRGICFKCGANLNETSCQCDLTARDARWGPLLDLQASPESTKVYRN